MNFINSISRQTWGAVFILLGAGLSCYHTSSIAGTILVGGGLAIFDIKKATAAPPAAPSVVPKSE